jgi:hypothetical protein
VSPAATYPRACAQVLCFAASRQRDGADGLGTVAYTLLVKMMSAMPHATSNVLNEGATEEKGENARLSSFVGALAVTDLLKTTLGPRGQGKPWCEQLKDERNFFFSRRTLQCWSWR